jgi:hypothetical protein
MTTNIQSVNWPPIKVSDNSTASEAAFKTALDAFDRSLVRPIISGELPAWVLEVQETWREAAGQIYYQIKQSHPRQYEEIAQQDPELLPRVDLLKREDAAIEEQCEKINESVVRVAEHIPKLEPDEEKAQKYTKALVDDGLAFTVRIRKQVVAVQTWYIEAFNRDRGAVD